MSRGVTPHHTPPRNEGTASPCGEATSSEDHISAVKLPDLSDPPRTDSPFSLPESFNRMVTEPEPAGSVSAPFQRMISEPAMTNSTRTERPRRPARLVPLGQGKRAADPIKEAPPPVDRSPGELRARFSGLTPQKFHPAGVIVFVAFDTQAPRGFEKVWRIMNAEHCAGSFAEEEKQLLAAVGGILFCCDVNDVEQMARVVTLNKHISDLHGKGTPTILVPHSRTVVPQPVQMGLPELRAFCNARSDGVDHIIFGEPAPHRLVVEVRSKISQHARKVAMLALQVSERREHLDYYKSIEQARNDIIWFYFNAKFELGIPDIEEDIGQCEEGSVVGGLKIGRMLGSGSFGRVHRLEDPATSQPVDEVLKIESKKNTATLDGVTKLSEQINLLKLLSSDECGHPHVSKLLGVQQTPTDILFRLSYGGPTDLYKRLKLRDSKQQDLTPRKVGDIMSQCLQALVHLHTVANVVHRDIKPENIIVSEDADSINITLTDFGLARVMPTDGKCRGGTGSFPFMAPEVVRSKWYKPYPADVWSMGIVCLEIVCGAEILQRALRLKNLAKDQHTAHDTMMQAIVECFGRMSSVSEFLGLYLLPEIVDLMEVASTLIGGMLRVSVPHRCTAARLHDDVCAHSSFAGI